MNLCDYGEIKKLLSDFDFRFSKSLGQNFIINPDVCPKMADMSGIDGESGVIEIGPGIGVLTAELAKRAKKVVCIELDSRLIPLLGITLAEYENIEIINADVLKTDLHALINEKFAGMKVFVCANLPYYITSPVIMDILTRRLPVESITVMVQKEAAERLCAEVGDPAAGAVTAAVRYYCLPQILFSVPRHSFVPVPKVDSAVIKLTPLKAPPVKVTDEKYFFSVVKACFAMRRKTLLNTVSKTLDIEKARIKTVLDGMGLDENVRGETLNLEQLARLAEGLYPLSDARAGDS